MTRKDRILVLLNTLNPHSLEIIDVSHQHKGHAAMKGLEAHETHFNIIIAADILTSLPRVKAHRKINELLKNEFANGLHAISIRII
jgi:BolA protein